MLVTFHTKTGQVPVASQSASQPVLVVPSIQGKFDIAESKGNVHPGTAHEGPEGE